MAKSLDLQKKLIGHYIEAIPEDCNKKVCYVTQGDGVWEIRTNKIGKFITHVSTGTVPGLKSTLKEGWELNVPLIPADILSQVISFFRRVNKVHNSEAFLQIFWDTTKEEYYIHCPKQTVGAASVKYDNDDLISDPKMILVLEIHSHNTMGAFFSGTDDADEKGDRYFGVIGHVDNFFPEIKLRLSVGGKKVDINVEDIFDTNGEAYHLENYPEEWVAKVEKEKMKAITSLGKGPKYYQEMFPLNFEEEIDFAEDTPVTYKDIEKEKEIMDLMNSGHSQEAFEAEEDYLEEKRQLEIFNRRNWKHWRW